MEERPTFQLDILTYQVPEGWAAHCLQLDLVEVAATKEAAIDATIDVSMAHISFAIENDNMAHLFHPAPAEIWKQFFASKVTGSRSLKLDVHDDIDSPIALLVQQASARHHHAA